MSSGSFESVRLLEVGERKYRYYSLAAAAQNGIGDIGLLPVSLKILLENLLRHEDGVNVSRDDILRLAQWRGAGGGEISYHPARVLMQDFTGVPALVDLAAMRDAAGKFGVSPDGINPQIPVDLVIDHSVMVDHFGQADSLARNIAREYERNGERYAFLKWGQDAFDNFRVVPPGAGICHQINLEYLADAVCTRQQEGENLVFPDTCIGTDSHTTMINALSVLGWGVGGIEAEAAMLGQPVSMLIPEVIGFGLSGRLPLGVTATDLVLRVVEMLREKGVVGKFVEFYGDGLDGLSLEDRATIANMAPEYGATCGLFPIDNETLAYLRTTGRPEEQVALVEAYARAQGLWRAGTPLFSDRLELDLSGIGAAIAGPKRPQDRIALADAPAAFSRALKEEYGKTADKAVKRAGSEQMALAHGDIVIAAITSCTNTSNPALLIAAGLLARKARRLGLTTKPWVKTSLAPGSQVVTDYLDSSGLSEDLDALGFNLVGYGCTTCIGNSGPLPEHVSAAIREGELAVAAILSGNRNFEGRINPLVRANYLASPPLVVAYALAGSMNIDLVRDPLGHDADGNPVSMADIWPSADEIAAIIRRHVTPDLFSGRYASVFAGDKPWQAIDAGSDRTYSWQGGSTYVRKPPYFDDMPEQPEPPQDIEGAAILGLFGSSVTTDHISPAGAISNTGPAGQYLSERQIAPKDYNSYGSRRGNHEVMMRGTFANIRIRNHMLDDVEGGYTKMPSGEMGSIFAAAMAYAEAGRPLIVFAGSQYGTGSSRDWAAKGTLLLGVRAVIAESFERIHRSNLVGMGVLPLQFTSGQSWHSLGLTGDESITIRGIDQIAPRETLIAQILRSDQSTEQIELQIRIDTGNELKYFRHGGILRYVLRQLSGKVTA